MDAIENQQSKLGMGPPRREKVFRSFGVSYKIHTLNKHELLCRHMGEQNDLAMSREKRYPVVRFVCV